MPLRRRPLLRAAAVGGSAYVMGQRSAQRAAASSDQDARISQLETQQTSPDAAQGSMLDELGRLTSMHDKGVLTDDEFTQAKAKLLNS